MWVAQTEHGHYQWSESFGRMTGREREERKEGGIDK